MKIFKQGRRSKYILIELLLGSAVIVAAAYSAAWYLQNRLETSYSESARFAAKITAENTAETASKYHHDTSNEILKKRFENILLNSSSISFIEYKGSHNNNVYVSAAKSAPNETFLSITAPVIINNKPDGVISIGMKNAAPVYGRIYGIFFILWLIFASILIMNIFLISKEAEKKYDEKKSGALELEKNKLEAVLMSIINGVIVCDTSDSVILANSSALKMLDIKSEHLTGRKIQEYTDSHGNQCFLEKIEEFKNTPLDIREKKPVEFNIEAEKRTIKAVISPMFIDFSDYAGYIIVLIDITRETEVNKLKNTFISNVSHELRTPVTVLRTYIDTLCNNADDFDEKTKQEFMHTIDEEAKRLHYMVNDILDFSRLESGSVKLRMEYADLPQLLKQNINSIQILADEKNIKINYKQEGEIPAVPMNPESMDRAVRNLLSNAVKYSNDGKDIEVCAKISEDKKYAQFSVKDNGIGIPKEHLDKIFDRFYRVENAAHTIKGTGLGLHLVKMTVEKHHKGRITVQSRENEGSVFTVYLPLTADENDIV